MGRKIPGKKHHGVRDPDKQRARREAELSGVINAPPKNIDDQEIPKSLERVIKLKNAVKSGAFVKKKKKKNRSSNKLITLGAEQNFKPHPKSKPEKIVPIFNQRPGESQEHFWQRVNRETQNFIKESEFETKYNVEVKRNPETGRIEGLEKKPKTEEDKVEKLKSKAKNINKKKKKIVEGEAVVKLSKSQKKKKKLLEKQERKNQDDRDEFRTFKDKVEFGDIVHAPPELKLKPLAKKEHKVKNSTLLLNSLLNKNNDSSKKENIKTIDRTGKRKDLPAGERRQLEKQQSDVVAAYRQIKAKQLGASALHL